MDSIAIKHIPKPACITYFCVQCTASELHLNGLGGPKVWTNCTRPVLVEQLVEQTNDLVMTISARNFVID